MRIFIIKILYEVKQDNSCSQIRTNFDDRNNTTNNLDFGI